MREWLWFRLELQPVPDHAVIGGKALLQDRWDSSRFGSGLGRAKPGLIAAGITRISVDEPTTIQNGNERTGAVGCVVAGSEGMKTRRDDAGERAHLAREFEESSTL